MPSHATPAAPLVSRPTRIVLVVVAVLAVLWAIGKHDEATAVAPPAPVAPVAVSSAHLSTASCWLERDPDGSREKVCGDRSRMPVGSVPIAGPTRVA